MAYAKLTKEQEPIQLCLTRREAQALRILLGKLSREACEEYLGLEDHSFMKDARLIYEIYSTMQDALGG